MTQSQRLAAALASLLPDLPPVDAALILGSGLGGLADAVTQRVTVPYATIAGFAVATAPDHKGQLVFGRLHGRGVVVMQGRVHLYEGWQPGDIALAIYLRARLGAWRVIVTNAAGALNPAYRPGDVMAITDHLNFTGTDPLTGPNDPLIGSRFPDLSRAYDPGLLARLREVARASGTLVHEGIYAGVAGPSLETSAERRFLRAGGADAVGMSTVHEVIAAAHVGLPSLGLSAIINAMKTHIVFHMFNLRGGRPTRLATQGAEQWPIPAIHYMIAAFGCPDIRVADYARYGTAKLARHVVAAMADRNACLMANHGMVVGGGHVLTEAQIAETAAAFGSYGVGAGQEAKA